MRHLIGLLHSTFLLLTHIVKFTFNSFFLFFQCSSHRYTVLSIVTAGIVNSVIVSGSCS